MQARPDQLPDHHFLLIAPNLGAEWLFEGARDYWRRFRPVVVSGYALVRLVPPERSIIVTALVARDTAADFGVELAQFRPDAYYDALVFDTIAAAREALTTRVDLAQPFGVPLVLPTATPDPNAPAIPTPRLAPTRPPAGFITQEPSPSATSTLAPRESGEGSIAPVSPTPGSIFGN